MNLELIGQLVSVALIVGAGPIVVAALLRSQRKPLILNQSYAFI